jgi:lipoyl(octanoyl) transferase
LVTALESAVVCYAAEVGVEARASREAPGVYVGGAKLASVGLRVRRGSSYHGLALNVTADLEPFRRINVCGYLGLGVIRLKDLVPGCDMDSAARGLVPHLLRALGFAAAPPVEADAVGYSAISTVLQAVSSR